MLPDRSLALRLVGASSCRQRSAGVWLLCAAQCAGVFPYLSLDRSCWVFNSRSKAASPAAMGCSETHRHKLTGLHTIRETFRHTQPERHTVRHTQPEKQCMIEAQCDRDSDTHTKRCVVCNIPAVVSWRVEPIGFCLPGHSICSSYPVSIFQLLASPSVNAV